MSGGVWRTAESHRAPSFARNTRAKEDGILEPFERLSCSQYHGRKRNLTPCGPKQFLEAAQEAENRYDLVDGILKSSVGKGEDEDLPRSTRTIFALTERMRIKERHTLKHGVPRLEAR